MVLLKKTTLLFLNSVSLLLLLFIFEKHVRVEGFVSLRLCLLREILYQGVSLEAAC